MSSKVLENRIVVPNVRRLVLEEPEIANVAKPGQFVIIMADEKSERIPFTLSDWNQKQGTITIFYLDVGHSTGKIANLIPGDTPFAVAGPLGTPIELQEYGKVLLGGGCYGIGAIYPLAKELKKLNNELTAAIEARSSYLIYNEEKLAEIVDDLIICTADGTKGIKGHVWDIISLQHERGESFDHAFFMGCTFMLMKSSKATCPEAIPTSVSLNALMVDGTGMCGACRVSVGGNMVLACVDGPTFDGHKVDWELLFDRSGAYEAEENFTYQFGRQKKTTDKDTKHEPADCNCQK